MKLVRLVVMAMVILLIIAGACSAAKRAEVKNVIVMISDGMGFNTMKAADYYQYGETGSQVYQEFPFLSSMTTSTGTMSSVPTGVFDPNCLYNPAQAWANFDWVRMYPTDSAAAATAMSTGFKTYNAAIGMDISGNPLLHCFQKAEMLGKSTGVISTVEWSHATPAGFAAHNINRNNYESIAKEMIYDSALDVVMGCGNPWFDDSGMPKSTPNSYKYVGGVSTWDDLVAGTAASNADADPALEAWTLIQTREAFQALARGRTPERVCGVAQSYTTTQQSRSGDQFAAPYAVPLNSNVPTLAEMTKGALNVLDNNRKGFCLMVEGGAVDWAGHANQPGRIIEEQIDFNHAVEAVVDWVKKNSNWGETLVIVTADHETGYVTGPGSGLDTGWIPVVNNGFRVVPGMEFNSGDHTNSLIPFFAKGDAGRHFHKAVVGQDPVYGRYIDNTAIGQVIFDILD